MAVKYIGNGASIPGIPAKDLSDEDIQNYVVPRMESLGIEDQPGAWLESTNLYLKLTKAQEAKLAKASQADDAKEGE